MTETAANSVLSVNNLYFSHNAKDWALQDVNVDVLEGEFVGIIGPNGGGKTTFLKLILGILPLDEGEIRIFGKSVKKGRREIGYFPQIKNVDSDFPITVDEAIMGARLQAKIMNFTNNHDKQVVERVMHLVDIYDLRNRKINELSGGQRNRVFLARALACEPKMLILDEPTSGLDVTLQKMFLNTLKTLNKSMTILIVDHNLKLLEEYVDKFICLNRCVAHGTNTHTIEEMPNHIESGECNDGDDDDC